VKQIKSIMQTIILTSASLTCASAHAQWQGSSTVQLVHGTIDGQQEIIGEKKVYSWQGIPYADNPLSAQDTARLRWMAPRDVQPWQGVLKTQAPGSPCIQPSDAFRIGEAINGSEACHFLNVWRPSTQEENLPVYIDIHGGANEVGQGKNMRRLAAAHNVILVSFNYRLSLFSHFYHPTLHKGEAVDTDAGLAKLDASGNYNVLDAVKVLQWVQDNIEQFGGDKTRVTVGGQSSGGDMVWMLLTSPLIQNKQYFSRAILRSIFLADEVNKKKDTANNARNLLVQILYQNNSAWEFTKAITEADKLIAKHKAANVLRNADATSIVCLVKRDRATQWPKQCGQLRPLPEDSEEQYLIKAPKIHDGVVLPQEGMRQAVTAGNFVKVPLMIGAASSESLFFNYGENVLLDDKERTEKGMPSVAEYHWLHTRYNPNQPLTKVMDKTEPSLKYLLGKKQSEWGFKLKHRFYNWFARRITLSTPASAAEDHTPLWVYEFSWAQQPEPFKTLVNATHCSDLPFWFNDFGEDNHWPLTHYGFTHKNKPGREALSKDMRLYWSNFVSHGDPNKGETVPLHWKHWQYESGKNRLRFDGDDLKSTLEHL
jgi:para-nitrobenzyl esterase